MNETTIPFPGEEGRLAKLSSAKLMMCVFLASDVMGFASLIAGYFYLRILSVDWPDSGELLNVTLTSINTVFLLSSSFTMGSAVAAIKRNDQKGMLRQLWLTISLGSLFLMLQGYEYFELSLVFSEVFDERPFSGHVFASTFFLLTGFHAAHVLAGLIYLGCIAVAAGRGRYSSENYLALDIAGLFWHFVDWIWVAVFLSLYII